MAIQHTHQISRVDLGQRNRAAVLEGEIACHGHLQRRKAVLSGGANLSALLQDVAECLAQQGTRRDIAN